MPVEVFQDGPRFAQAVFPCIFREGFRKKAGEWKNPPRRLA